MIGMFDRENRGTVSYQDFGALWRYVTDWQRCFKNFDQDNSGNIDRRELQAALTSFGFRWVSICFLLLFICDFDFRLSDPMISLLVRKFDRFGRGTILFDDFIQCCVLLHVSSLYLRTCFRLIEWVIFQMLTSSFRQYDTNNTGIITIQYEQFLSMVFALKIWHF